MDTRDSNFYQQLSLLSGVFKQLSNPRKHRGVRHRFDSLCVLVLLGLMARITEMAVLVRWASKHWDTIKEPLGFTRDAPPSVTCVSRSLAKLSLEEFHKAFADFINLFVVPNNSGVLGEVVSTSIDGKTSCQGTSPPKLYSMFLSTTSNLPLHNFKSARTKQTSRVRWRNVSTIPKSTWTDRTRKLLKKNGIEFRKLWRNALEGDWLDKSLGLRGCWIAMRLDYVHQFSLLLLDKFCCKRGKIQSRNRRNRSDNKRDNRQRKKNNWPVQRVKRFSKAIPRPKYNRCGKIPKPDVADKRDVERTDKRFRWQVNLTG